MQSVGAILAAEDAKTAAPAEAKPRVHRVTLAVHTFAEIDVVARDAEEARQLAVERAREAKRTFITHPAAHRVRVQEQVDWRLPESPLHWVDVEIARPRPV